MVRLNLAFTSLAILIAFTGCASTAALEDRLVFQPRQYPVGDWTPVAGAEDVAFASSDDMKLHGWFAAAKHPRAVVLFLHGNAGNITVCKNVLRLFRDQLNASVLVFDYRGYGRSEGKPSEAGVLEDARAARRWLAERTGIREADVVLVGHSLGGGVAVDLAAKDGARGLVLWNTFTSLPDVGRSFAPFFPIRAVMHNSMNSLAKIHDYRGPLLQTHGEADRIIPYELGTKLFAAANEPKQFVRAPGGGHNDAPTREFLAALDQFLDFSKHANREKSAIPNIKMLK